MRRVPQLFSSCLAVALCSLVSCITPPEANDGAGGETTPVIAPPPGAGVAGAGGSASLAMPQGSGGNGASAPASAAGAAGSTRPTGGAAGDPAEAPVAGASADPTEDPMNDPVPEDAGMSEDPEDEDETPTPTPARPLLAVYVGNDPDAVGRFEAWLGHPVDGVLGYTGDASWEDYDGSVGWAVGLWGELDRRILWSVPLIPKGASLEEAAAGSYNAHYRKAAQTLATYRPEDAELYIRTGWEFNGDWFPWAAKGKAAAFVGAFRNFVSEFRAVSDRFVFDWNVNIGDVGMNPEDAYPGDDYVDIISMDFYWNTQWDPADAEAAWSSMVDREWGLSWHQAFAEAHGKRTSYAEWGVMSNDAGPYIEHARDWFEDHDVVYQTYWDSNNAFRGQLSNAQYPQAAQAYKSAFPAP